MANNIDMIHKDKKSTNWWCQAKWYATGLEISCRCMPFIQCDLTSNCRRIVWLLAEPVSCSISYILHPSGDCKNIISSPAGEKRGINIPLKFGCSRVIKWARFVSNDRWRRRRITQPITPKRKRYCVSLNTKPTIWWARRNALQITNILYLINVDLASN